MDIESLTRLRNALARVAVSLLAEPAEATTARVFPPPFSSMSASNWRDAVRLWKMHAADLLAGVPERPCPACGSEASRFLFVSYDAHPFHECDACGCWFLPKHVDGGLFDALFERSPEARALAVHMMRERDRDQLREADLARIGGYLDDLRPILRTAPGRPATYLDAGCGVGHSLRAGQLRGFIVQGVEVDATAVELARAAGLPVATPPDPVPPGPYDLLSFWETLEHIADPLGVLTRFVPYLADDGLVAITVPNMGSPQARVMREACSWVHGGYNTPGHVNLFHAASLERLLNRAGLSAIECDGQFSNNPIELAAFVGARTNGAFDALSGSPSRGEGLPDAVASMLTAVWPAAALLERMALATPILRVIACRRGREARFADAMAERRQARKRDIASAAQDMIAAEPDYKAMSETLQMEVNRRDELLRQRDEQYERTVDRRVKRLLRKLVGR